MAYAKIAGSEQCEHSPRLKSFKQDREKTGFLHMRKQRRRSALR